MGENRKKKRQQQKMRKQRATFNKQSNAFDPLGSYTGLVQKKEIEPNQDTKD